MFVSLVFIASVSAGTTVLPDTLNLPITEARFRLTTITDEALANGTALKIRAAAVGTDGPALTRAAERGFHATNAQFLTALGHQRALIEEAVRRGVAFSDDVRRAVEVTKYYSDLESPRPPFPNTAHALRMEQVIAKRLREMQTAWRLSRIVHRLREYPEVLRAPEMQRALRDVVVDRIAAVAGRSVWLNAHPLGWRWDDQDLRVTSPLQAWPFEGENWPPSPRNYNRELLNLLVHELSTNAQFATRRRHCESELAAPARQSLQRLADGRLTLEFEDFGDPSDYQRVTGLGESHSPRAGVGIGRFRAFLIADFLEYKITHEPKPDGSGSVVRVIIPKDHGL